MSMFLVLAACGFASSFSLRLIDPLILPVATHFSVTMGTAAMLSPAYALPYALAQPFLGPISDRFGRMQCMNVCMAGLAATLLVSAQAPSFELLFASRMAAGVFGGGLIPLVLAALGDAYDMKGRQVAIGRMLFALISGQMLGSIVAGFAAQATGWRSAFRISAALACIAAALLWAALRHAPAAAGTEAPASFGALYGRVFANPKAAWLYMLHNCLQTEATELAPTARGSAVALFASGLFLGQGAGPLLFGPLAHVAGHAGAYVLVALALALLGQVVVLRIVGRPR